MKLGYQGDLGSNNEDAAYEFVNRNFTTISHIEYIPLISSKAVIDAILNKQIDYGVCAVRSYTPSETIKIEETTKALKDTSRFLESMDVINLPIHHCLFKLPNAKINTIASHKEALIRTKNKRENMFPDFNAVEERDTAWCAKALRSGELPPNYAVICKKETGDKYSLECLLENMEDESIRTEFMLFRKYEY